MKTSTSWRKTLGLWAGLLFLLLFVGLVVYVGFASENGDDEPPPGRRRPPPVEPAEEVHETPGTEDDEAGGGVRGDDVPATPENTGDDRRSGAAEADAAAGDPVVRAVRRVRAGYPGEPGDALVQTALRFGRTAVCPDFQLARDPNPLLDAVARDFYGVGFSLEEKLLIASGVRSTRELAWQSARLRTVVAEVVERARADIGRDAPPGHLAWALRAALHQTPLKTYVYRATDLRLVLGNGQYNCLSGTAMYWLAARAGGLPATAYLMRGHVVPLVHLPQRPYLIEITRPQAEPLALYGPQAERFERLQKQAFLAGKLDEIEARAKSLDRSGAHWMADKVREAACRLRERLREDPPREERIRRGLSEVDEPALVASFVNNMMWHARDPAAQLRLFVAKLELLQQSRCRGRIAEELATLDWMVDLLCEAHGYRCAVDASSYLIHHNHDPHLARHLRDRRADLYADWILLSDPPARRAALDHALLVDPEHPVVDELLSGLSLPAR